MAKGKKPKSIGIVNQGKNNTFIDIEISGTDIGIQDEGEGSRYWNIRHFGPVSDALRWFQRPIGIIVLSVISLVIGAWIAYEAGWVG